ncbi:MAG: TolC family outer membrane protein [Rhodospirillaceae bacterium]|nr:TolC family outer membrane protein [Rhodospirillaceae bacterium]
MRRCQGAGIALVTIGMALAAPAQAQTFQEEVVRLLDTHPEIKAERARTDATNAGVDEALGAFLPRIDLSASNAYAVIDSPSRRSAAGEPYRGDIKKATLTITQNLFDGFLKDGNLLSAKANYQAAGHVYTRVQQTTLLRGIRAYLDVLRQTRLAVIARENENNLQTQLSLEDERVKRGSGLTVDVLAAKSRLQIAKEQRVAIEGALKNAISLYARAFGAAPDLGAMDEPPNPSGSLPATKEEAIRFARKGSPLILERDSQIAAARGAREAAWSGYFPKIDLVGSVNYEEDAEGTLGPKRDGRIMVQLSWNLYAGGSTTAAVRRTSANLSASMYALNVVDRAVIEEVEREWQNMETAAERVALLENAVNIAAEVLDARTKLRAAGKESAINVLDSESELNFARINHEIALFEAKTARYRLLNAMGRLTPTAIGVVY